MSEATDPKAWVAKAEEDYVLARSALRHKKPLTSGASFHAQQCAEKYLKAALVARGHGFPKTHDLLVLHGLCARAAIVVPIDIKQLNRLSTYAVLTRYPGGEPTSDEAREALETAQAVRRFMRRTLGIK